MTKIEKMNNDINKKFDVRINILKAGGCWTVKTEKGCLIENNKMKEIREYILMHSEELEDDDI